MIFTFTDVILYFIIYSFFGWVCEKIYCVIKTKKAAPCGFLAGPYCLSYGFGSLTLVSSLFPLGVNPVFIPVTFLISLITAVVVVYVTSQIMEFLFNIRWWDYSERKLNFKGRITLINSVSYAVLGVILIHMAHPLVSQFLANAPTNYKRITAGFVIVVLLYDFITSLNALFKLENKLKELDILIKDGAELGLGNGFELGSELGLKFNEKTEPADYGGFTFVRLMSSYPQMKHISLNNSLTALDVYVRKKTETDELKFYVRFWHFIKSKVQQTIETVASQTKSLTSGLSFQMTFWIFIIASVMGFVVETIFCLFKHGYIESRQGLIYGPFSQVYGIAAVIIIILIKHLEKLGYIKNFIYCAILGGAFEYVCSFIQEKMLGTVSWEYGKKMTSVNGRTSIIYMMFWGVLGVIFIKEIYPKIARFIERIPDRKSSVFTWILLVFLCFDIFISVAAVARWARRDAGEPPSGSFSIFLDKYYDDEFLTGIYPNMKIINQNE